MRILTWLTVGCGTAFAFAVSGCLDGRMTPAGSYSDVLLVSEDGPEDLFALELSTRLLRPIDYYVDREKAFSVEHARAADLADLPRTKNVVLCGVAHPGSHVGRLIENALGTRADEARRGVTTLFERRDSPRPGQTTIVVTAPSAERLGEVIRSRGDRVVEMIEESCRARLRRHLLHYRDEAIMDELRDGYGFHIEVPQTYRLLAEGGEPPGVELLCEAPARLIGVFWLDGSPGLALADSTRLFAWRAKIAWNRYDCDLMDSTRVAFEAGRFGAYPAVTMAGYWSNCRSIAGGCYETHFVYQALRRRLWAVDLLVYSPGVPKHPSFRELRALAETFSFE
jgi:hypothetical protein